MGTFTGCLRDPVAGSPRAKWWEVLETSLGRRWYMFFKFNSETYKTYLDRLLKWIVLAKNSVNSIVIKKIIQTGMRNVSPERYFWNLTWGSEVKFLFQYFNTSKYLSHKYLSKLLWWSTFSLKESKSLQHSKENLFELGLYGYISMKLLFT